MMNVMKSIITKMEQKNQPCHHSLFPRIIREFDDKDEPMIYAEE